MLDIKPENRSEAIAVATAKFNLKHDASIFYVIFCVLYFFLCFWIKIHLYFWYKNSWIFKNVQQEQKRIFWVSSPGILVFESTYRNTNIYEYVRVHCTWMNNGRMAELLTTNWSIVEFNNIHLIALWALRNILSQHTYTSIWSLNLVINPYLRGEKNISISRYQDIR